MFVALGLDIQQGAKHGVTGVNDRCIGLIRVLGGDHCNHFTAEVCAAGACSLQGQGLVTS